MATSVSIPPATAAPSGKAPVKTPVATHVTAPPAHRIVFTVISNPRVELLFYSLVHQFENVSFQPLSLEDLLPATEPRQTGHLQAAGLLVDEASLGLPGVEAFAEELPHRVIVQRGTDRTEPLPPKWGAGLDMRLPVAQFIGELAAWLRELGPQSGERPVAAAAKPVALTQRERQVLDGLTTGARYADIADSMGLSIDTIRGHLKRVYRKLHVQSRTAAVATYLGSQPAPGTRPRHEVGGGNLAGSPGAAR